MSKIMVIDGDELLRSTVAAALRRQGHVVLEAMGGKEGLALASAQRPDLVLCEVSRAGLNGVDVPKELRARPESSGIPVIIMMEASQMPDARLGLDRGADDCLIKPFALEQMLAAVQARLPRPEGVSGAKATQNPAARMPPAETTHQATGDQGLLHQMTARGFRHIMQVVILVFIFALIQMYVLQRVCNEGMNAANSLERQGLPNMNHLATLQQKTVLFRLYSYEYLFARESERPRLVAAAKNAEQQVRAELVETRRLLQGPKGQQLTTALEGAFVDLAGEFDRVQGLVDKDFAGAMNVLDHDIPPKIQKLDEASEQLNSFGYLFSGTRASAAFNGFNEIKRKTIFFGAANIAVGLGLGLFVLLAASRTRSQLAQTLEQLNEQARELRLQTSALEAAASGIVITRPDGRILWVNPAFTRLTGYEFVEIIGRTPVVLKSGRQDRRFYADLWQTIQAGKTWHGELVNQRKDGSHYDEEMTITPLCGPAGAVQNFIAIKQDVSERKRTERVLAGERDLLQALMDNLPDFIYFKDLNSRFTRINLALARHLGLQEPEQAIGRADADFFRPSEARQKLVDEERLLVTGEPILGLVEKSETAREVKWVSSTKVPIHGADGKITGLAGISRDITKIKQIEDALQRQKTELQVLLDYMPAMVWFKDTHNRILRVNKRVAEAAGRPAEEIEGQLLSAIYPRDAARHQADDLEVIASRVPKLGNIETLQDREGKPSWVQTDKVPVCDHDGRVVGIVVMAQDITERKRAELERQMMELQLRQSQKLESIGQLAAGIAHEINTPTQYVGDNTRFVKDSFGTILKVLQRHVELLAAAEGNAVTPELLARNRALWAASDLDYILTQIPAALEETLEGVERVTRIVRAMKDFSHPGGKEKAPADLNKAIESTVTVARNEWKYVAELKLELEPGLPLVPCFLGEFNQAILNLIVNAAHAIGDVVKQSPGTKGQITVRTRRVGDDCEVRVTDTGPGIPEAVRPKIFEPFFTTKEVGKGTGQGLAMIYGSMVRRHGGTVTFETEVGKGTTFIIRLPVTPKTVPPAAPARLPEPPAV